MNGYSELQLGPLDDVHASVVLHPGATLLSLIAGSVGGRPHGVPRQWQHAVVSVIAEDAAMLRPLFDPYQSIIPDCLTATATMADADIDTYLDMLADLDATTLTRELAAEFGAEVPALWRPVMDRPQAWIRAYARLMSRLWREFRTVWHGAGPAATSTGWRTLPSSTSPGRTCARLRRLGGQGSAHRGRMGARLPRRPVRRGVRVGR